MATLTLKLLYIDVSYPGGDECNSMGIASVSSPVDYLLCMFKALPACL